MTTKVILNMNTKLKSAAMKKARSQGMTLSAVVNIATQAYVNDSLVISAFERDLAQAYEEMRQGKGVPAKEVYRRLGIKK